MTADSADDLAIPPLFVHLVDDTSLLRPRASAPAVGDVVERYLEARAGRYGEVVGRLACPVSRLSDLIADLARRSLDVPVDISLVVDTGLGAVPKALSTVLSRTTLVTARSVETAAPPDVDAIWLERVAEFVPDDIVPVVEPRRPQAGDAEGTVAWLDAVRRVADAGCTPKLRCGGPRASDVPVPDDVARFVQVVAEAGRGFTTLGLREIVHSPSSDTAPAQHGLLNMLVAVARAVAAGDVRGALASTDVSALAGEVTALPERAAARVRELLSHCGAEPGPGDRLAGLGLLT